MKALTAEERFKARKAAEPPKAQPATQVFGGLFNAGKMGEARLDRIPQVEDCKPGLRPVEYNVIIAVAEVAETMGAKGLLLRSDQDRESEQMALQIGRIIDMSPLAFNYDEWHGHEEKKPKVGDVVWFARYAGGLIEAAADGQPYRIVKDKDIGAVIETQEEFTEARFKVTSHMLPMEIGDVSGPMGSEPTVAAQIHALESRCPTEWVDVRVRLQEAYEACPAGAEG